MIFLSLLQTNSVTIEVEFVLLLRAYAAEVSGNLQTSVYIRVNDGIKSNRFCLILFHSTKKLFKSRHSRKPVKRTKIFAVLAIYLPGICTFLATPRFYPVSAHSL